MTIRHVCVYVFSMRTALKALRSQMHNHIDGTRRIVQMATWLRYTHFDDIPQEIEKMSTIFRLYWSLQC